MPKTEKPSTLLAIDRQTFEKHFSLEGAGRLVALDALAGGTIEGPYEVIETVCLVNRLFASMYLDRMLEELAPFERADEYVASEAAGDHERSARLLLDTLGEERILKIIRELFRRLRDDIGVPECEVRETPRNRPLSTIGQRSREHPLSWLAGEEVTEPAALPVRQCDLIFFNLEGPGYSIVKAAFKQGIIGTPYEMVEMLCAVNEAIGAKLFERLNAALVDHGHDEPLESSKDSETAVNLAVAALGGPAVGRAFAEAALEVAEQFHVSVDERRPGKNEKHELWLAATSNDAS